MKSKADLLKSIRDNLQVLVDSDLTSIEEAIILSNQIDDIDQIIEADQKVEVIKG